jgi:hypothetical protein
MPGSVGPHDSHVDARNKCGHDDLTVGSLTLLTGFTQKLKADR